MRISFQSTKKMINSSSKTTDQPLCFRSAVRYLRYFYLTNCTSFLMKMSYYHSNSHVFDSVTLHKSIPITHELYQSFDNDPEERRVFLDIFKAIDKA